MATTAVTPESYHLTRVVEMRDQRRKVVKDTKQAMDEATAKACVAALRAAGFRLPAKAPLRVTGESYSYHRGTRIACLVGSVHMEVPAALCNAPSQEADQKVKDEAERQARILCKLNAPGVARQFGSWARARFGRKLDAATIAAAHDEWIGQRLGECAC